MSAFPYSVDTDRAAKVGASVRALSCNPFELLGLVQSIAWRYHHSRKRKKAPSMAVVLIVEDDEQVRVLAESVLQEAGHNVIAATGVEGATALLQADQKVDVVFVDLTLGNDPEAGLRFAHDAKGKRSELSFLYTTGSGVNAGMQAMFVKPFLFLPKPYTLEQLTQSVAFLLRNAQPRQKTDWPPPQSN